MRFLNRLQKTFALQMVVLIIMLSIIIFLLMFSVSQVMIRRVMVKNAEMMARSLAADNIGKIEGILSRVETQANSNAYLISQEAMNWDEKQYFSHQISSSQEISSISVAYTPQYLRKNKHAKPVTYHTLEEEPTALYASEDPGDYQIEDWFIIPVYTARPFWSEPWVDNRINTEPITSYSVPIFVDSILAGVIRTDISLKVLQRIVAQTTVLKTGFATLLTSNGTYVTHPADSLILNYTIFNYASHVNVEDLSRIGLDMVRGGRGFVRLPKSSHYDSRWMYYAPVSLNKWSVGVEFRDSEIMGDLNRVILIFNLILVFGLLLLLVSVYVRINSIFKPLRALVKATEKIGAGDFNAVIPDSNMQNEVSRLTTSFSRMQRELKTFMENLVITTKEKDRITAELKFAAQIQQKIIPSNQNLLTEVKEVSIFGILESAEDIGGDFYDAFMINDSFLCFVIADVFGKGIVASILMTMAQTLIRSQARYSSSVVSIVREVNSYLCANNKQANFITCIVGTLDLKTGVVDYCNAGHTPLCLKKPGLSSIRFGETHCTAMGIFEDLKISSSSMQLDAQDYLILFTDGITEAMTDQEEFFGLERMEEIISQMQNPTPEGIANAIIGDVHTFIGQTSQTDDLSILVLKFNHPRS